VTIYDLACHHCGKLQSEHHESRAGRLFCSETEKGQQFEALRLQNFADEREAQLWGQCVANGIRGNVANCVGVADLVIFELRKRIGE